MSSGYAFSGSNGRFYVRLSYTVPLDTLKIAMAKIDDAIVELTAI